LKSIQNRILAGIGALQLTVALLAMILVVHHSRRESLGSLDANLASRASSLLALIQVPEEEERLLVLRRELLALPAADRFRLTDSQNHLIAETPGWGAPDHLPGSIRTIFNIYNGGVSYRTIWIHNAAIFDSEEGEHPSARNVNLLYGIPTTEMDVHLRRVAASTGLACLVMLCISLTIAFWVIRAGLRPLAALATEAMRLDAGKLEFETPAIANQVSELQPLSSALTDSIKRLKNAFEWERRMFGDAAHELKTAIAIVKSTLQVALQSKRTGDEYRKRLLRALDDTVRLEVLTIRMLQLAAIEDPVPVQSAETDVIAALEMVVEHLSVVAEVAGTAIHFSRGEPHCARIPQQDYILLVTNLIENAIQHGRSSMPIELAVNLCRDVSELTVQDFGIGIASDALPHIFDRFFRTDQSRSRETGGFGLGLTMVHAIVVKYGGAITVSSQVGRGARFTVFLPASVLARS